MAINRTTATKKVIVSGGRAMGVSTADPFNDIPMEVPRRLTIALQGHEKMGKTHFALTATPPIALININRGTAGVIQKFKNKEIKQIIARLPNKLLAASMEKEAKEQWEIVRNGFIYACTSGKYRSLVVDAEDEMWALRRLSEWGKLNDMPTEYAKLNAEYLALLNMADEYGLNLILISKLSTLYKNKTNPTSGKQMSVATSNWKRDGFKHVGYAATEILESQGDEGNNFWIQVIRSRHRSELNGVQYTPADFENGLADFANLATVIIEGSTRSEWE